MAYRFESGEEVQRGIRRMVCEQLDKAVASVDAADDDPHAAVHDVRKRCKKIRALARLVRPALGDRYDGANRIHRDVARRLSTFRDAQAVVETVNRLVGDGDADEPVPGGPEIRAAFVVRRERVAPLDEVRSRLRGIRPVLEDSRADMDLWSIDARGFDAVAGGVERVYRRGRHRLSDARHDGTADDHHEWRKRVKYLWYAVRVLRPLWPGPLTCLADELDALSDVLGEEHDAHVLHEVMAAEPALGSVRGADALLRRAGRDQRANRRDAYARGEKVYAEKPARFVERLRAYDVAGHHLG